MGNIKPYILIIIFSLLLMLAFSSYKQDSHNLNKIRNYYIDKHEISKNYVVDNYFNTLAGDKSNDGNIIWKELPVVTISSNSFIEYFEGIVLTGNKSYLKEIRMTFSYSSETEEINVIKIEIDENFYSVKNFSYQNLRRDVLDIRNIELKIK